MIQKGAGPMGCCALIGCPCRGRKSFEGTVSYFVTGSGKRMVAYRKPDGTLLYILPEPEQ